MKPSMATIRMGRTSTTHSITQDRIQGLWMEGQGQQEVVA